MILTENLNDARRTYEEDNFHTIFLQNAKNVDRLDRLLTLGYHWKDLVD